ncbi:MAG: recombinase family protein [Clostridia bacterium]|nr:recombinase family protein [Clostridia bacterium]
MPRAALYARFSSDNQREESIDAQLRAMREYCLRNNVVIANEYCDHARSATTDDRPEFQRLIRESKNCEFNIVIVHKLDRFSRDRYDSAYYKRELKRSGVSLISVLENLDDSPESIILESVLEGMSEYYSRNLAREVMKGMRESALQCRAVGGCAPFGYKINPETKRYEIEEDEIDAVRMIFDKVLEGVGYGDIIHDLNSMGYLTRGGKPFGKNSLHEILRNEKYRGVYIFNRVEKKDVNRKRNNHRSKNPEEMIRIEGGVPQIIDDKVWEGVQAILNSRTKHRVSNNSGKETYLLTGKIICGECGHSFTGVRHFSGRNKLKYVCYHCSNRKRTISHACRNKEIRREYLETFVMQEISRMIFDELDAEKIVAEYYKYHTTFDEESTNKLKQLNGALQSINKKIDNIISAVANTGSSALLSSLQDYEAEREKIKRQIEEVEKQSKTQTVTETMVELAYEYARGLYRSGDKNLYRQLIHLYVDKIIVYYDHVEFYLNTLPADILKGELDRSLGIGEEETLVDYMMRCDPSIVEALKTLESNQKKMGTVDDGTHGAYKRKKAENPLKINELSTFIGGGDGS